MTSSPMTVKGVARPLGLTLLVAGGSLVMAAASWVEVPMVPVPMNLQSLAAPLLGMLLGARLGCVAVLLWLGEACLGLPVLSGGGAGAHHLAGPTGGYLIAFPISALLAGWLWQVVSQSNFVLGTGCMLAGNILILALGTTWLSTSIGWAAAAELGLFPFLVGAILKSACGGGIAAVHATKRRSQ